MLSTPCCCFRIFVSVLIFSQNYFRRALQSLFYAQCLCRTGSCLLEPGLPEMDFQSYKHLQNLLEEILHLLLGRDWTFLKFFGKSDFSIQMQSESFKEPKIVKARFLLYSLRILDKQQCRFCQRFWQNCVFTPHGNFSEVSNKKNDIFQFEKIPFLSLSYEKASITSVLLNSFSISTKSPLVGRSFHRSIQVLFSCG